VAIKIISYNPNSSETDEALKLFRREIQAIAKLDHPHILPLYDFGEAVIDETSYAYMIMPYCKNGTLATWLMHRKDNNFPFPALKDVADILSQAADALQQAHYHPNKILHLDVKPDNFLIHNHKENPNTPYLLLADFGVAKFVEASTGVSTTVRGSIEYMPKEQWEGDPQPASDQYALAVIAYQLLTYQRPFEGRGNRDFQRTQFWHQHRDVPAKAPSTLNSLIPPEIDAVILKGLAKNYEERYPSITDFANAFKQALINNASTRVILSISKTEAETGGSYPLKLPDGRQIPISVPAGVQDGQEFRQEGLGVPAYEGGPNPALIITINVKPESESERKITNQLQSLEQAFKNNQSTNQILLERVERMTQTFVPPPIVPNPSPHPKSLPPNNKTDKILKPAFVILFIMLILSLIFTVAAGIYQNQQNTHAIATATARSAATVTAVTRNVIATTTATYPYPSYLPGHGIIDLHDSLDGTNNYYHWDTTSGCNFTDGAYHVIKNPPSPSSEPLPLSSYLHICTATPTTFNNFAVEVTMTINSGNCGGIAFGKFSSNTGYYLFQICSDGNFFISQQNRPNEYIHSGLHQPNILTVVANGNQVAFYVNHHQIQTYPLSDYNSTYSKGQIGFLAANYNQPIADVSYTNAKVWTL
jgi:serine/threonine protein kinase